MARRRRDEKRRARRGEVPERILAAALRIIERRGSGALTVTTIADAADVYPNQFYKYWKGIGPMLEDLAARETKRAAVAAARLARSGPRDLWKYMYQALAGYLEFAYENPGSMALIASRGYLGDEPGVVDRDEARMKDIDDVFMSLAQQIAPNATVGTPLGIAIARVAEGFALEAARQQTKQTLPSVIQTAYSAVHAIGKGYFAPNLPPATR